MWSNLELRAEVLRRKLPKEQQDAFFQLVYYPVVGSATVARIYNSASIGDAENINLLMEKDRELTAFYNDSLSGGKWRGMMLDNHIGYTKWSIPDSNQSPLDLGLGFDHSLIPSSDSREKYIPAHAFSRKTPGNGVEWIFLPDLGRGKGCMGSSDVMAESGTQGLRASLSPLPEESHLALSGYFGGKRLPMRNEVFDNIRWLDTSFQVSPGKHTLKIVMIDPEIVVEQIVVNPDNDRYGYFPHGFFDSLK